jgi:hypothetical protein
VVGGGGGGGDGGMDGMPSLTTSGSLNRRRDIGLVDRGRTCEHRADTARLRSTWYWGGEGCIAVTTLAAPPLLILATQGAVLRRFDIDRRNWQKGTACRHMAAL